jgi:GNAT superfamily N-acetyltransferase
MDLRRASLQDAALAAQTYLASRKGAGDLIPPSLHDDENLHWWMREVFLPNAEVWFAVEDGRVLGLLGLQHEDWLEQLYVVPEAQGLGVGSALVDLAKQLRPRGLQLWAYESNTAAHRFYEGRGFVAVEFTDGATNEEHAPDRRYVWRAGA